MTGTINDTQPNQHVFTKVVKVNRSVKAQEALDNRDTIFISDHVKKCKRHHYALFSDPTIGRPFHFSRLRLQNDDKAGQLTNWTLTENDDGTVTIRNSVLHRVEWGKDRVPLISHFYITNNRVEHCSDSIVFNPPSEEIQKSLGKYG